jgi:hypothetical protein
LTGYLEPEPEELDPVPAPPEAPVLPEVPPPDEPPGELGVAEPEELPLVPDVPEVSAPRRSQPATAKLITAAAINTIFEGENFSFIGIPFIKS